MISAGTLNLFALILMRMSGCIFMNPILGRRNVPTITRVGLTMMLTFAIMSFSAAAPVPEAESMFELLVVMFKEFAIGYVVGFIISLFAYAVTFGGEVMDLQMGLSMTKMYDPASNINLSLFASFFNIMFMLLFFAAGGHITLVRLLLVSGNVVPYGQTVFSTGIYSTVLDLFCQCVQLAVKFALPIIAIELLVEVSMGLIMKAVPQINVFVLNIQIKVFAGFLIIVLLYIPFAEFVENIIARLFETLESVIPMFG